MRDIRLIGEIVANNLTNKTGKPFTFDYAEIHGAILPVVQWADTKTEGAYHALAIHEVYNAAVSASCHEKELINEIEHLVLNIIDKNSTSEKAEQKYDFEKIKHKIKLDIVSLKENPGIVSTSAFNLTKGDLCVVAVLNHEDGKKEVITPEAFSEMKVETKILQYYAFRNTFDGASLDFENVFQNEVMTIFILREGKNQAGSLMLAAPNVCNCIYHIAGQNCFIFPVSKDFSVLISVKSLNLDFLELILKPVVESYIKDIPEDRFLTRDVFVQHVESADMIGDFIPLEAYLDIINGR